MNIPLDLPPILPRLLSDDPRLSDTIRRVAPSWTVRISASGFADTEITSGCADEHTYLETPLDIPGGSGGKLSAFIPLDEPADNAQRERLVAAIRGLVEIELARQSVSASQDGLLNEVAKNWRLISTLMGASSRIEYLMDINAGLNAVADSIARNFRPAFVSIRTKDGLSITANTITNDDPNDCVEFGCLVEEASLIASKQKKNAVFVEVSLSSGLQTALVAPMTASQETYGEIVVILDGGRERLDASTRQFFAYMSDYAALIVIGHENYQEKLNARLLSQEMKLAGHLQSALLIDIPAAPESGRFRWSGYNEPARENGGDLMEIFEAPDGALFAVIGDVMGKGLGAALIGAGLKLEFARRLFFLGNDNQQIITALNHALYSKLKTFESYVTANYLRIEPDGRSLAFVNAGHLPAYLFSKQMRTIQILDSDGLPIGILPDEPYLPAVYSCAPGDTILMLTDGLTEAENASGAMPGETPYIELFSTLAEQNAAPGEIIESLVSFARNWHGGDGIQADDVTAIVIRIND